MVNKMAELTQREIGQKGEDAAVKFLKKNKYRILKRNYKFKTGEIDIICENKDYIVFVEVKTRKSDRLISGVYAVNSAKQRHILNTASHYLLTYNKRKQPRFDIIDAVFDADTLSVNICEHYIDAFSQGGDYAAL